VVADTEATSELPCSSMTARAAAAGPSYRNDSDSSSSSSTNASDSEFKPLALLDGSMSSCSEDDYSTRADGNPEHSRTLDDCVAAQAASSGRGRAHTRGISCCIQHNYTYYAALVTVGMLQLSCRGTPHLETALDQLVALTRIKQHALQEVEVGTAFDVAFRNAVLQTLHELGFDPGVVYSLALTKSFWMGRNRKV
jgi:hypothetical protein